ncbi:hypothetical protein CRG98_001161 [Punica granatum]|uniref:peroxidase n=1 Tax=Punica granatum TaxID=22663 RepID=A0A2I0LCP4_PUNGR|nr:hypothetical protein CRG98_001161 [Punica granatum]
MDLWKQMRFFSFMLLVYTTTMDPKWPNPTQIVRFKPSRDINAIITARFLLRPGPSDDDPTDRGGLEYDYYRESCPQAERIVREMVQEFYRVRPRVIPSLLRLAFHDCFIEVGAHSVGSIHCNFFEDRLYNFSGTNRPDPSLESEFLNLMRSRCSKFPSASSPKLSVAPSPSFRAAGLPAPPMVEPETVMSYEGLGLRQAEDPAFGAPYYQNLLEGRGILFADQQLTGSEETGSWVRAYAWDAALFRKDFAEAMLKLSSLQQSNSSGGPPSTATLAS